MTQEEDEEKPRRIEKRSDERDDDDDNNDMMVMMMATTITDMSTGSVLEWSYTTLLLTKDRDTSLSEQSHTKSSPYEHPNKSVLISMITKSFSRQHRSYMPISQRVSM